MKMFAFTKANTTNLVYVNPMQVITIEPDGEHKGKQHSYVTFNGRAAIFAAESATELRDLWDKAINQSN